jgi:cobalamin biosynthesis protein CbiD
MNALCNGLITGGCAAAAVIAAVLSLVEGRQPEKIEEAGL